MGLGISTFGCGTGLACEIARSRGAVVAGIVYHVDLDTALRGLMSVGLSTVAMAAAGEAAVRDAITEALEPFKTPSGGYRLENAVYCLVASK